MRSVLDEKLKRPCCAFSSRRPVRSRSFYCAFPRSAWAYRSWIGRREEAWKIFDRHDTHALAPAHERVVTLRPSLPRYIRK